MENKKEKTLVIERMYVDNFHFSQRQAETSDPVNLDKTKTQVMRRYVKIDDDRAKVELRVRYGDAQKTPVFFDVTVGGIFYCDKFESNQSELSMMKNNTLAILFPYLRSTLASLSGIAGVGLCLLPIVNTFDFFGDQTAPEKTK